MPVAAPTAETHELTLERIIAAPPALLFRAWTEPALLQQWFVPAPWSVASVQNDVRAGGSSLVVMRSPDGQEFPNPGVYLEVVPDRRLVFTDAFVSAWQPSGRAFMVATISFDPRDDGRCTRYHARVQHWSAADRAEHEKMGFHEGWGKATDQLEALVATLA